MSTQDKFIARFGEDEARNIMSAATQHSNETNSGNKGSDEFRWAIIICIGYECMEVDGYRKAHGITTPWEKLRQWIIEDGDLGNHEGDGDYLAMFAGAYNEFMPEKDEDLTTPPQ